MMKYRSRINILLVAIIATAISIPFSIGMESSMSKIITVAIVLILTVLMISTMRYTISERQLTIKTLGFKMAQIDIADIRTIKSSYDPLSSPAASLRRLEIRFWQNGKTERALISPVREEEFISKLQQINPKIEAQISKKRSALRFWDWDI